MVKATTKANNKDTKVRSKKRKLTKEMILERLAIIGSLPVQQPGELLPMPPSAPSSPRVKAKKLVTSSSSKTSKVAGKSAQTPASPPPTASSSKRKLDDAESTTAPAKKSKWSEPLAGLSFKRKSATQLSPDSDPKRPRLSEPAPELAQGIKRKAEDEGSNEPSKKFKLPEKPQLSTAASRPMVPLPRGASSLPNKPGTSTGASTSNFGRATPVIPGSRPIQPLPSAGSDRAASVMPTGRTVSGSSSSSAASALPPSRPLPSFKKARLSEANSTPLAKREPSTMPPPPAPSAPVAPAPALAPAPAPTSTTTPALVPAPPSAPAPAPTPAPTIAPVSTSVPAPSPPAPSARPSSLPLAFEPIRRPRHGKGPSADYDLLHNKYFNAGRRFKYSGDARFGSTYPPTHQKYRPLPHPPALGSPYHTNGNLMARLEAFDGLLCFVYALWCGDISKCHVSVTTWRTIDGFLVWCKDKWERTSGVQEKAFVGLIHMIESFILQRMIYTMAQEQAGTMQGLLTKVLEENARAKAAKEEEEKAKELRDARRKAREALKASTGMLPSPESANSTPTGVKGSPSAPGAAPSAASATASATTATTITTTTTEATITTGDIVMEAATASPSAPASTSTGAQIASADTPVASTPAPSATPAAAGPSSSSSTSAAASISTSTDPSAPAASTATPAAGAAPSTSASTADGSDDEPDFVLPTEVAVPRHILQSLTEMSTDQARAGRCQRLAQAYLTLPILRAHFPRTYARVINSTLALHEEYEPDMEDDDGELSWPGQSVTGEGVAWCCLLGRSMVREYGLEVGYLGLDGVVVREERDVRMTST